MLYFVGVGPGDPELLTLKAARILRAADAIALPDSGRDSVVYKIAGEWMGDKPLCRIPVPMHGARKEWEAAHSRAAEMLLAWLQEYETIAYPVLGDPGVYASSSYLMRRIAPHHPCRVVPGVPAMCAAAAELGVPLCEQGETLTVMDAPGEDNLPGGSVVLMKSGKRLDAIGRLLSGRKAYAVRNLGMADMCCGSIEEIARLEPSYFTTVIIRET